MHSDSNNGGDGLDVAEVVMSSTGSFAGPLGSFCRDQGGVTALMRCCGREGNADMMHKLLRASAERLDVNITDDVRARIGTGRVVRKDE